MTDSTAPSAESLGYDPYDSSSTRNRRVDLIDMDDPGARAADLAADALFAVPRYEHRVVTQEQIAEAIARAHLDHEIFCGKQRGAA